MNDISTERQFFTEYDQMKTDLKQAQQEIILLTNQLRDANAETEKLAFKCDFLTREIARVTASREQYERVAIRVAAKMDGALDAWTAMAETMKDEIRDAAFTKVPSMAPIKIETEESGVNIAAIAAQFGAGFEKENAAELARRLDSEAKTETLPAPKFGSGPQA